MKAFRGVEVSSHKLETTLKGVECPASHPGRINPLYLPKRLCGCSAKQKIPLGPTESRKTITHSSNPQPSHNTDNPVQEFLRNINEVLP